MGEPLYVKLLNELKDKIQQGILETGDALPSENELARKYGISRVTVRRSLSLLEQEGYVHSVTGKGYFIREPVTNKYILNFNELGDTDSPIYSSRLLEVNVALPDLKILYELRIPKDKYVVIIKRLLILEDKDIPVAYDVKYLPYEKGIPLVEREIKYATFPELVGKKKMLFSIKKELKISAEISRGELGQLLKIGDNKPLLRIDQKLFSSDDKVIGWGKTYYVSEFCTLTGQWSFGQKLYEDN